jgi:hypothetical protein|nr:MAG TPA: hypothetical protein [Caudoviricetes sp.]
MKTIFEVRDRVFDIEHGWGTIIEIDNSLNSPIVISFDKHKNEDTLLCYNLDGSYGKNSTFKRLSFSQYLLERFSQIRPIVNHCCLGKYGRFWNNEDDKFYVGRLFGYYEGKDKPFETAFSSYKYYEPFTDEQLEILKLE